MIKLFTKTFSLLFVTLWFYTAGAAAQTLKVAIAANLQPVMKALEKNFKQQTKIDIDFISGSSGNLAAQIRNGAPYDVFLSADRDYPQSLQQDGLTLHTPVVYALGVLIICSAQNYSIADWKMLLLTPAIRKIAIGNPAIAPYGKAAQRALTKAGIYDKVKSKIVFGESISQVNTYVTTGVVQAAFTTLSLIKDQNNKQKLFYSLINLKDYAPIEQAMVLLRPARGNAAAEKFYRYILSPQAKTIFKKYGYHTL